MMRLALSSVCFLGVSLFSTAAFAVKSAEFYTSASYRYGRVEARLRFAAGDGVVSSFFLWKVGSEVSGTFWNELDIEKVGADCHISTNALYGNPGANHSRSHTPNADFCGAYHTYAYEWTPESLVWFIDGVELRRETGDAARAFADNAPTGMQIRLNVWPGDASFGGNFNPSILPVHQYVDWVQFSSYAGGTFTLEWREDFDGGAVPTGWLTANWASPKNLSTHDPGNVNFIDGYAVISLTADNAVGPAGAMPGGAGGSGGAAGSASGGTSGSASGGAATGGAATGGAATGGATMGGSTAGGAGGIATSGASGVAPTGGAATAGAPGTGGGPAGGSATSGAAGSAGDATPEPDPASDSGCGCRVAGQNASSLGAAAFVLGLAALLRGRRLGVVRPR
jgi:endo-1,3-1,4-beta-glycanase ExoK